MRIAVGKIGRPHGIRGVVSVLPLTDEPDRRFAVGAQLYVADSARTLTVTSIQWHSGRLLLGFAGITDREAVEQLRSAVLEVEVDPQELPEGDDEFYDHQLIGLAALALDGEPLGTVTDVLHLPGHDVLAVTKADDSEVLVPFVGAIVTQVDLPAGTVTIDAPAGLFEELADDDEESTP